MTTYFKENFSRIEAIERKFREWSDYYQRYGMEPIRVYISRNWFQEMIDEVERRRNTGIFTETIFNNRQGVRVYKGLPLYITQDSDYFQVEGTIRREVLDKCNRSLTWNAISTTVKQ